MPESPDFDQIARTLVAIPDEDIQAQQIVQWLRSVWNARGDADLAILEAELSWMQGTLTAAGPSVKNALRALRSLDR